MNKFGRKGGRGWRPWFLLPKVLVVAVFFGAMAAVAVILLAAAPADEAQWRQMVVILERLYWYLVIPGATVVVVLGIALLLDHPRVFLKLRWLQVKLALGVVTLGALHVVSAGLMQRMRMLDDGLPHDARRMLAVVTVTGILLLAAIILLGRHKPRLGQNWARDYPAARRASGPDDTGSGTAAQARAGGGDTAGSGRAETSPEAAEADEAEAGRHG